MSGFSGPEDDRIRALLILRQLHDGDVIDYPIPDDSPWKRFFEELVSQGLIARWDRVWPLHDRYRLTEPGVATIGKLYRPAEAESVFADLRRRDLAPEARPSFLRNLGHDPLLWPALHDPHTHWMTWGEERGPYSRYVWARPPGGLAAGEPDAADELPGLPSRAAAVRTVDLDRESRTLRSHDDDSDEDIS